MKFPFNFSCFGFPHGSQKLLKDHAFDDCSISLLFLNLLLNRNSERSHYSSVEALGKSGIKTWLALFLSPAPTEGSLNCVLCTLQNGHFAAIWTTAVEELSSAGELKEGVPLLTCLYVLFRCWYSLQHHCVLSEVAVFTEGMSGFTALNW